jgi:hypothetical protein
LEQSLDGAHERGATGSQLTDPLCCDFVQQPLSPRQKGDQDLPPVFVASLSAHVAVFFQAVNQLNGTVVFQREPFRKRSDGSLGVRRKSANGKQHEILLGFKAGDPSCGITLPEKQPDTVAKLG